ncbi:hypothetical protein [Caballeronia grimmiae]|uniref:hypothetical protein n=1 Tax=Caballeronia grimmiae TaxID=1071679 RepID=UPI0038B84B32
MRARSEASLFALCSLEGEATVPPGAFDAATARGVPFVLPDADADAPFFGASGDILFFTPKRLRATTASFLSADAH